MGSRLLQAIVGVGISLGTSACGGMMEDADDASAMDDALPSTDAAAPDVADVVILDAFCDAPWPVTKGSVSPYICGSTDECAEAGTGAPTCYQTIAPSDCTWSRWATWCVSGQWECATGAVPKSECKCWDRDGGCP